MRMLAAMATLAMVVAGCDRPVTVTVRKPVEVTLNPKNRTLSVESEGVSPTTKDKTQLGFTSQESTGTKGEWPLACVVYAEGRISNPQIVVRVYDEDRGAVRVEAKFTGPRVAILGRVVFPHISKAERFTLKNAAGESPYAGTSHKGENLEIRWPDSGDGTVTFLAWPHTH